MASLRWEKPPHSTGKTAIADIQTEVYSGRYLVRRISPHSRQFTALRDGRMFEHSRYSSFEAAKEACELDADAPKSTIKLTHTPLETA